MHNRCKNPRHPHARDYAGRGIGVCERWGDFAHFVADMGTRPTRDHSIDRIDNMRGYSPDNCRWATRFEQHRNKRNNLIIEAFGESLTLAGWAERTGLLRTTITGRLKRGWTAEQALSTTLYANGHARAKWNRRAGTAPHGEGG